MAWSTGRRWRSGFSSSPNHAFERKKPFGLSCTLKSRLMKRTYQTKKRTPLTR